MLTALAPARSVCYGHTSTLLADGTVLVAGGEFNLLPLRDPLETAELYDPASDTWSLTGSMAAKRILHTATLLADGTVLVAGGQNTHSPRLAAAERYRPAVVPPGSEP